VKVPFNVKVPIQTAGGSYYWAAESAPKPVTKLAFGSGVTLAATKCEGIVAISRELARLSAPGTEPLFQRALVSGLTAFSDRQFLDPAVAAVAGTNPASITNGLTPVATGATLDATVAAVLAALFTARPGATGAVLVTSPANASRLAGTGNNLAATVSGGSVQGVPLVPSEGALTNIIAIDPGGVVVSDGGVVVDISDQAALQFDDAPVGTAAAVVTSLWQTNQIGFKVERLVNYAAVPGAVAYAVAP
jgi:HK97 family phage major capsid protein